MRFYLKTKDHFLSQEEFELFFDDNYQMLVTKPQPKELEGYYQSDNYISHSDAKKGLIEKVYQIVKRYNLAKKVSLINRCADDKTTLLDIGAGTGNFILQAKKSGWSVTGIEPNSSARQKASEKGIELLDEIKKIRGEKFNVITLWHVLEHLSNIKSTFQNIVSHLEQDGTLVIAVPNFKSHDAKYYGGFWAGYDVPRHLYHFSQSAIKKLAEENGMVIKRTKPMWFDSFYVSLLSEKYKNGKSNFVKAIFVGMVSNVKALFTKECSSLIYVLRKSG